MNFNKGYQTDNIPFERNTLIGMIFFFAFIIYGCVSLYSEAEKREEQAPRQEVYTQADREALLKLEVIKGFCRAMNGINC